MVTRACGQTGTEAGLTRGRMLADDAGSGTWIGWSELAKPCCRMKRTAVVDPIRPQ
jgi:hypothetical protein